MKNKKIKQLVVNAMFIALLVVSSFISIPINNIPYTLQLLMVFIILILFDFKNSLIIFGIYIIMGLAGLPVFSGFSSGLTPTLGFIIGIVFTPLIYFIINKVITIKNTIIKKIINCLICLLVIDIFGCIYYMIYFDYTLIQSILLSIVPYILIDILKIGLAIIITNKLQFIISEEQNV